MVAQYVGENHRRWDKHIPQLQFAFNTVRQEATGYTPAFLIHGRELALPHPNDPATTVPNLHRIGNYPSNAQRLVRNRAHYVR